MIVLESIDPRRRSIAIRKLRDAQSREHDDVSAMSQVLIGMGEPGLQILEHTASGENAELEHEWFLTEDGLVEYRARFPQERRAVASVNIYTAAALATYMGRGREHLMQLRLAIYELCVNALEHGTPLSKDSQMLIALRFEEESISGWIQDACEAFDPLEQPLEELESLLLRRAARGYGLRMAIQLLDELSYEHNETGNLLRFSKRMVT